LKKICNMKNWQKEIDKAHKGQTGFFKQIEKQTTKKNIMPIQLLYTDGELLKIRKSLLKKIDLTKEDLNLLGQINNYCKTKN